MVRYNRSFGKSIRVERVARQRTAKAEVSIAGEKIPLHVNWHARARRFILRLDARSGGARLTLPVHADLDDAISFLKRHERWLMNERRQLQLQGAEQNDSGIPLRGEMHDIVALGTGSRRVWTAVPGDLTLRPRLIISGPAETARGRMVRWLKAQARDDLQVAVGTHAAKLDVKSKSLSIRDQRSRWGSCSSTGTLSFSWRLIMAPPMVLDYVAAHEAAHLREMNHSKRFWDLVESSYGDTRSPRNWLRAHGQALHRYGN